MTFSKKKYIFCKATQIFCLNQKANNSYSAGGNGDYSIFNFTTETRRSKLPRNTVSKLIEFILNELRNSTLSYKILFGIPFSDYQFCTAARGVDHRTFWKSMKSARVFHIY